MRFRRRGRYFYIMASRPGCLFLQRSKPYAPCPIEHGNRDQSASGYQQHAHRWPCDQPTAHARRQQQPWHTHYRDEAQHRTRHVGSQRCGPFATQYTSPRGRCTARGTFTTRPAAKAAGREAQLFVRTKSTRIGHQATRGQQQCQHAQSRACHDEATNGREAYVNHAAAMSCRANDSRRGRIVQG